MTARLYDEIHVRRALKTAITEAGDQSTFAVIAKTSPQSVSDAVNGSRSPSDKIVEALGFERVTRYVRRNPSRGGLPG